MNPLALAYLVLALASHQPQVGIAKFYSPGLMESVARKRGVVAPRFTSSTNCSDIGHYVLASLYDPVKRRWAPAHWYMVADCSAPRDRTRHVREGLIMEVDYRSAREAHFAGEGKTRAIIWRRW